MGSKKIASLTQEQRDQLPLNGQRLCLTIEVWEYRKEEEREVKAVLSPEDFRVWMIQRNEHISRMSFETWGNPPPVELSWPKVVLPPELAHVSADKIFMMTKKNEFKVIAIPQE